MSTYTLTQLARDVAMHVETVRYYQRLGLVERPRQVYGATRRYSDTDLAQLRFIKRAREIGFSLKEVAILMDCRTNGSCDEARQLTTRKLASIDQRLEELSRQRRELARWIVDCEVGSDGPRCSVIDHLESS